MPTNRGSGRPVASVKCYLGRGRQPLAVPRTGHAATDTRPVGKASGGRLPAAYRAWPARAAILRASHLGDRPLQRCFSGASAACSSPMITATPLDSRWRIARRRPRIAKDLVPFASRRSGRRGGTVARIGGPANHLLQRHGRREAVPDWLGQLSETLAIWQPHSDDDPSHWRAS